MLNRIIRRKTRSVSVGNITVGSDSFISVQSMTNTLTHDYVATLNQIERISDAGFVSKGDDWLIKYGFDKTI